MLTSASFATNTFYAGSGADIIMFSTKTIDAVPALTTGFSAITNTKGMAGFLIPDETFVNFNYTWYTQGEVETKGYTPELEGIWYLEYKEGSPFIPFLIVGFAGEIETETEGEATDTEFNLSGKFGLGTKYQIGNLARPWGLLFKTTANFDEGLGIHPSLGIYFEF